MDKRNFRRLVWIIDTLMRNKRGLTLRELQDLWDDDYNMSERGQLSKALFYRSMDRIFENFGIQEYRFIRFSSFISKKGNNLALKFN